ncbi:MAG: porin [Phycisphaerales bacterium]
MLLVFRTRPQTTACALIGALGTTLSAHAQQRFDHDQIRATVAEVLADIEARTSLLDSSATAGHDERGFFLAGADGKARLYTSGLIQVRYILNFRNDAGGTQDEFDGGFQNRRTQLVFSGNVSEQLSFRVQTELKSDGSAELKDAYAQQKFESGWAVKVGQFKPPLLREELVGDLTQLAAERSVVNSVFNQGRSQGVEINRESDTWRLAVSFTDGLSASNTDFDSPKEADYALTSRVEWRAAGDWKQFKDFSSWRGSDFAAMLGGAFHYQSGSTFGNAVDVDILEYTFDLSVEGDGWNGYAAFVGRNQSDDLADYNDYGLIVQGGVLVTSQVELYARYDLVLADSDRGSRGDPFNTISAGLTYFLFERSHAAQFRLQASWFLDPQAESIVSASTSTGVLADTEGDQFAVMFEFGVQF